MSFDKQVSEICKASYFHIRALRHIRSSLCSYSNSRISTRLLQLSCSWHMYLKPCSTTACTKYTCSCCYPKISALRHIRSSLTTEACKTIATAIVGSRLDYMQLSSSWHIYLKPCSTTACTKYTCSSCYPKISVSVTSRRFFLICTGFPSRHRNSFKLPLSLSK